LPEYGLKSVASAYDLYRISQKTTDATPQLEILETITVNTLLELTSGVDIHFNRITGVSSTNTLDVLRKDGYGGRRLVISSTGSLELSRL
jgi:hypothetical protein